jgi:hypothetical protein
LADAYVQADPPKRDVIERIVAGVNAALTADPTQVGESRTGRQRIVTDPPCAMIFRVNDPIPGAVRVIHFWIF